MASSSTRHWIAARPGPARAASSRARATPSPRAPGRADECPPPSTAPSNSPARPSRSACRRSPGSSGSRDHPKCSHLGGAPQAARPDGAPRRSRSELPSRATRQSRTSSRRVTAPTTTPAASSVGKSFERVNREVDLAVAERPLELGVKSPCRRSREAARRSPASGRRRFRSRVSQASSGHALVSSRMTRSVWTRASAEPGFRDDRRLPRRSAHRSLGAESRTDRAWRRRSRPRSVPARSRARTVGSWRSLLTSVRERCSIRSPTAGSTSPRSSAHARAHARESSACLRSSESSGSTSSSR